jgi:hypothetical protein
MGGVIPGFRELPVGGISMAEYVVFLSRMAVPAGILCVALR